MKKTITLSAAITCLTFMAASQQPANPGFENWTQQTLYEEPVSYPFSSNQWTYPGNVKKVSGAFHGLYAAELTTVVSGTDSIGGLLLIGTPGQGGIDGGMPYTGQPDSISAYVKYDIKPTDTGYFAVGFKNSGVFLALNIKAFIGVQSGYVRISIPSGLPPSPAPDSMVVLISSSSLDYAKIPGSTITIDSITFIGTAQGCPNPSFENWTPLISEEPNNWTTLNSSSIIPSATKSTSSYAGTYALRLESVEMSWGDTMGIVTNGRFANGPEGGMRVYSNPLKVTGYYKYIPVGPDTALAGAGSYINTVKVDSSYIQLIPAATYTYFEMNLSYNLFPYIDTLNITFASGNVDGPSSYIGLGSVLYIDDLTIVYNPVSNGNEYESAKHSLFPNPFTDVALFTFSNPGGTQHSLFIYDLLGHVVMKKENITSGTVLVQRSSLPAGLYTYSIREESGKIAAQGKLVIE